MDAPDALAAMRQHLLAAAAQDAAAAAAPQPLMPSPAVSQSASSAAAALAAAASGFMSPAMFTPHQAVSPAAATLASFGIQARALMHNAAVAAAAAAAQGTPVFPMASPMMALSGSASAGPASAGADWMSPVSMSREGSSVLSHPALLRASPSTPHIGYSDALLALSMAPQPSAAPLGSPAAFIYKSAAAAAAPASLAPVEPVQALQTALAGQVAVPAPLHAAERSESGSPVSTSASRSGPDAVAQSASRKRKERSMDREALLAEIEDKRRRNTESARRSRERKTQRLDELERTVREYADKIASLQAQVAALSEENERLRSR
ncbi:hypothetical protein HK105_208677 [Polyrhizophydium stewartii]|uniref:BZIP domain-containing protein n=1 Tax=Polyrhizophydium stewartii TaxID=2732419 RepID=A0ABR4MX50_9FUNG